MFSRIFGHKPKSEPLSLPGSPLENQVSQDFIPQRGEFFRTLDYAEHDLEGTPIGKMWMEAGCDDDSKKWVLWKKSITKKRDILTGEVAPVLVSNILIRDISFIEAYDQMTTFELSMGTIGREKLDTTNPLKLAGDYYKNFAYREGLVMSKSGRLYPFNGKNVNAANHFSADDITAATAFLERLKAEQFIAEPIIQPTKNWEDIYETNKQATEMRLNVLLSRFNQDTTHPDLLLQVIGHEKPEVLIGLMKRGFTIKTCEENAQLHFNILAAAIERQDIGTLQILSDSGLGFCVQSGEETPTEIAIEKRRYSHLNMMLSRDGEKLVNFADKNGHTAAITAIQQKDRQAFRMLYLSGINWDKVDQNGWLLIHHAIQHGFVPALNVWEAEQLPIDAPIKGTSFTAVSIAKANNDQLMLDYAQRRGANMDAMTYEKTQSESAEVDLLTGPFDMNILYSQKTNDEILTSAANYVSNGGNLNVVNIKGESLYEVCWARTNDNPSLDRRALIEGFSNLGADPSLQLEDGTTPLTRLASAPSFDIDYFKAIAPFAKHHNATDANGNNALHTLLLNPSQAATHTNNILLVVRSLPQLDLNKQNDNGHSSYALAIIKGKARALTTIFSEKTDHIDWSAPDKKGWNLLDLAFTQAAGKISDETVTTVGNKLLQDASASPDLRALFNRHRPDGKTLAEIMQEAYPAYIPKF